MKKIMNKIEHQYKDINYLEIALTHSSYANEGKRDIQSNERFEFLGDSVLSIVVSDYLFRTYPDLPEGELTKLRAQLVCEKSLNKFARKIDLQNFIKLGKGEENSGGRERSSICADAFEAVIASIYLDSDYKNARKFILKFVKSEMDNISKGEFKDYKTHLQEVIQQNKEEVLQYVLIDESGPDHNKCFSVEVHLNSNVIGRGTGRSKKEAEQMAAKEALELMGI